MVQGTGLHVLVERAISLNRPLRTRMVGGVGAGGEKPLATRLGIGVLSGVGMQIVKIVIDGQGIAG